MKKVFLVILILCVCSRGVAFAQITQGGVPLFLEHSLLRSSSGMEYFEMPPFNVDSVKQMDELNRQNMRSSFQFAYKFYTHIEKGKQGNSSVLADKTKVWQVGVRSKGAYSINLLFTRFRVPEGGKLFIYNADGSHVIGAFDHRNNSSDNILPVRPVAGDALIIEYSEPANAAFEGELIIGEVNHDYRDILRAGEPDNDLPEFSCMPDVLCANADERIVRSTVLLVINGTTMCSGSLVNNTGNNETPYLLTAVHCLNNDFNITNPNYTNIAGTIIAFFNYNRPACGTQIKATEEMSLAGALPQAIIEKKDVALLKFKNKPPVHYNAYYAGLNVDSLIETPPPFFNIHHPNGSVKKYGKSNTSLELYNFGNDFDEYSHFGLSWSTGSTHAGSSGSPMFDKDFRIMGTLTGGSSTCTNSKIDYFTALYQSWGNLKTYLNPSSVNTLRYDGYDPHAENPVIRISNADYIHGDSLIRTESTTDLEEAAEKFNLNQTSEILGVYVLIPPMSFSHTSGVSIKIYGGDDTPGNELGRKSFIPQYLSYNSTGFSGKDKNTLGFPTETFVAFDQPVKVTQKFFVACTINRSSGSQFFVYNTRFASPGKANTAWVMNNGQWAEADVLGFAPTSLALQPLIRYTTGDSIDNFHKENDENWYYNRFSGKLSLDAGTKSAGVIFIYAASGQMIEKIAFSKGEKSFKLAYCPQESIGIVKIMHDNQVISKKILY